MCTDVDKLYGFQVLLLAKWPLLLRTTLEHINGWAVCFLALGFGNGDADITYRLQAAARAVYLNKWILLDTSVSINSKWNCLNPASPRSLVSLQDIGISDNVTFASLRKLILVQSVWSLLVQPLAWNVACMERTSATNHWIQTPKIEGTDWAVTSLEPGGLHCEPSTQSFEEASIYNGNRVHDRWAGKQIHDS